MHDCPSPPVAIVQTFCSIIKIPSKEQSQSEPAYEQLVLTAADRANIAWIIRTMADNGKLSLLMSYKNELKRRGAEINHVHPLKFLAAIFDPNVPDLKCCMFNVFDDYFKREGFLDGLAPSLTREADRGKLEAYIPGFAKDVGASPDAIRPYFHAKDWDGLVRYLIGN
jgi:hypothetical protein